MAKTAFADFPQRLADSRRFLAYFDAPDAYAADQCRGVANMRRNGAYAPRAIDVFAHACRWRGTLPVGVSRIVEDR